MTQNNDLTVNVMPPATENVAAVQRQTSALNEWADQLIVDSDPAYETASNRLQDVKRIRRMVDEIFDPGIKKAFEAHKASVALKRRFTDPLDAIERTVKAKLLAYYTEQERRREQEQREAAAKAAKVEAERRAKLEAQAKRWEEKGNLEKAQELREAAAAVSIAAPVIQTAPPSVSGISVRKRWRVDESKLDKAALIAAAAVDSNLAAYLDINVSALEKVANATQGAIKIPGVVFVQQAEMAASIGNNPNPKRRISDEE